MPPVGCRQVHHAARRRGAASRAPSSRGSVSVSPGDRTAPSDRQRDAKVSLARESGGRWCCGERRSRETRRRRQVRGRLRRGGLPCCADARRPRSHFPSALERSPWVRKLRVSGRARRIRRGRRACARARRPARGRGVRRGGRASELRAEVGRRRRRAPDRSTTPLRGWPACGTCWSRSTAGASATAWSERYGHRNRPRNKHATIGCTACTTVGRSR